MLAYDPLLGRVADHTRRRVFDGEAVPARDKMVSLFVHSAIFAHNLARLARLRPQLT